MKSCPTCSRVYANGALRFCRHGGALPVAAPEVPTRLLGGAGPAHKPRPAWD